MHDAATDPRARVALIRAGRDATAPIHEAFAREWPGATVHDLLDSSLSADRAAGCDAGHATSGRRDLAARHYHAARHRAGAARSPFVTSTTTAAIQNEPMTSRTNR